jgi:hypothetical protein
LAEVIGGDGDDGSGRERDSARPQAKKLEMKGLGRTLQISVNNTRHVCP